MITSFERLRIGSAAIVIGLAVGNFSASARAQDDGGSGTTKPADASASASHGAFLPWTMSAGSAAPRALVSTQGGYDTAHKGAVFQTTIESRLYGALSLRAGGSYLGPRGDFRPDVGLKLDTLRQDRHGVDLAVAAAYEAQGFNLTPAVILRVAAARTIAATTLIGNLAYGAGLEASERYGDVRLAAMQRLGRGLHLGLDSRFRIDLERDDDEPSGEPESEVVAGPLVAYSFGQFLVSASGGVSAIKFRAGESLVGAVGTLGFGAVF